MFHTVGFGDQFNNIPNTNIDDTKETLILLLELLLVKYLYSKYAILVHFTIVGVSFMSRTWPFEQRHCLQVEALIPIRIQCSLGNLRRLGLLAIDGGDRKRVGKSCRRHQQLGITGFSGKGATRTEDISLV